MKVQDKKKFFDNSEKLKTIALNMFDGEDVVNSIYCLIHAASVTLKEQREVLYKEGAIIALNILLHLEDCTGCEHDQKENEE